MYEYTTIITTVTVTVLTTENILFFWFSTQGDIFGCGSGGPVVFILMVYIYIK